MRIKDYKELEIWKKGIEIVDFVYDLTAKFPAEEKFGLAVHMRRTSVSIPSNIAEGFVRQYRKEYKQFLFTSLGSCAELETQAIVADRRHYVAGNEFAKLVEMLNHESRMIMNLVKSLEDQRATSDERRATE